MLAIITNQHSPPMKNEINLPRRLLASAAFIASTLLFASTATALTMTFDNTVDNTVTIGQIDDVLPYKEDGLRLQEGTTSGDNWFFASLSHGRADRPTDYFGWIFGSEVELVTVSGNPFSLTSIQFGNVDKGGTFDMDVTGYYASVGNISETLSVTSDPWETHSFSGAWTNLQSVIFSTTGVYKLEEKEKHPAIDTIVATEASVPDSGSVPIPDSGSALTMLGCGILSLACLRRKLG